ncbi:MAG: LLM class flavin-dependent oxidoreductase [Ilumatobacteraceae bacterium]|jgi:5,10-methylenetetrahydromethanopterin reductase
MPFDLSCAFATSMATPDHVAVAESLGYHRAWLYDSPALYPDVWATLARCAERTSTIGLGPGVLIPSLRHPMVNAAAIAMLVDLAGADRVAVAVGTGFTGRCTLGQRPLKWADVVHYVRTLKALLRGEIVEWEGAKIQMMHPEGCGAERPISVPFLLGAAGPVGIAAARDEADGVFLAGAPPVSGFAWQSSLLFGTVVDEGADLTDERIVAAAGHGAAVFWHFWYEHHRPMSALPSGVEWEAAYADVPADVRHLATHDRHLIAVNDRDRPLVTPDVLRATGAVFTAAEIRERLDAMAEQGMTEIAYQPAGPDIPGELERFAEAVRG